MTAIAEAPKDTKDATQQPAKTLRLPDLLRSYHDQLVKALTKPVPFGDWDETQTYVDADQPAAIAAVLIRALHDDIRNAELRCVYRKKLADRDRVRLAQASRVGGKLQFFAQFDLLIEVNWEEWVYLTDERKIALIDHELCHFSLEIDDEGKQKYVMLSHDIEEFRAIVDRWGLWKPDVQRFAMSIERGRQLDIFASVDPVPSGATAFPDTTARVNGGPPQTLEAAAREMGEKVAEEVLARRERAD
jgi:hypothetical protein